MDESEQINLGQLIDLEYPEHEKTCVTVVHNPSGQQGDNFSYTHDFTYFVYPKGKRSIAMQEREDEDTRNFRDVTGDESLRTAAQNCFYPILIKDSNIVGFGEVCDDLFHPNDLNIVRKDGIIEIYPIDPQGIERKWRFARNTVESIKEELEIKYLKKRKVWDVIRNKNLFNYKTVWSDSKYSANNHGTQLLNNLFGKAVFSYPKSLFTLIDCVKAGFGENKSGIVLDFFAGSGTTGHAILDINKIGNGNKIKYLLIEVEDYFYTALLPRLKKIIWSDNWSKGLSEPGKGISQFIKYYELEQYEEALANCKYQDGDLFNKAGERHTKIMFL
jgi:adenine-specific DNA-methyltransferase